MQWVKGCGWGVGLVGRGAAAIGCAGPRRGLGAGHPPAATDRHGPWCGVSHRQLRHVGVTHGGEQRALEWGASRGWLWLVQRGRGRRPRVYIVTHESFFPVSVCNKKIITPWNFFWGGGNCM